MSMNPEPIFTIDGTDLLFEGRVIGTIALKPGTLLDRVLAKFEAVRTILPNIEDLEGLAYDDGYSDGYSDAKATFENDEGC